MLVTALLFFTMGSAQAQIPDSAWHDLIRLNQAALPYHHSSFESTGGEVRRLLEESGSKEFVKLFVDVAHEHFDEVLFEVFDAKLRQLASSTALKTHMKQRFIDADDLVQEAWLEIPDLLDKMKASIDRSEKISVFGFVLLSLQRKLLSYVIRAQGKVPYAEADLDSIVIEKKTPARFTGFFGHQSPEWGHKSESVETMFANCLKLLPAETAYILFASKIQKRPQEELANEIGVSYPTLKVRIFRWMSAIRPLLQALEQGDARGVILALTDSHFDPVRVSQWLENFADEFKEIAWLSGSLWKRMKPTARRGFIMESDHAKDFIRDHAEQITSNLLLKSEETFKDLSYQQGCTKNLRTRNQARTWNKSHQRHLRQSSH